MSGCSWWGWQEGDGINLPGQPAPDLQPTLLPQGGSRADQYTAARVLILVHLPHVTY